MLAVPTCREDERTLDFDRTGKVLLRGLAPETYRFKVFPDELVLDPETIDCAADRPRRSIELGWTRKP